MDKLELNDRLKRLGIYSPDAMEQRRFEDHLTRYMTRDFQRLMASDHPSPVQILETSSGPMWESTQDLMDEHYDEPRELFTSFLDRRYMAYSMAYYGEEPDEIRQSKAGLEAAQQAKLALIVQRAEIQGTERVFSIGCGFAPLETYLTERFPEIEMTAITPSRIQCSYIRECLADSRHPLSRSSLSLIEGDFAAIPETQLGREAYDVIFAVGCFEHIANLRLAFDKIAALLKPGGRVFLHLIVYKPVIMKFLDTEKTLIGKYFPGGKIWPYEVIRAQGGGALVLEESWFLNGLNYWRTLDAWHHNFSASLPGLFGRVLNEEEVRYWNQYFSLCKALFAPFDGTLYGNGHFRFRKRGGK